MDIGISVVIPTYNRKHYIRQCIESVLCQTLPVYEIIIVDDGSTDDTIGVISDYIKSGTIKYLHQDNAGVSAARNAGFALSSGTHIAFLDSDDLWKCAKIQEQVAFLKENPQIKFVHNDVELIDGNSSNIENIENRDFSAEGFCFDYVMQCCSINISSALIDRIILEHVGVFDTRLSGSEDYELMMRIAYCSEIGRINKKLSCYRIHSSSTSSDRLEILLQAIRAIDVLLSKNIIDAKYSNLLYNHKSHFYYRLAKRAFYELNDRKKAFLFILSAIRIDLSYTDAYILLIDVAMPITVSRNIRWYTKKAMAILSRK